MLEPSSPMNVWEAPGDLVHDRDVAGEEIGKLREERAWGVVRW